MAPTRQKADTPKPEKITETPFDDTAADAVSHVGDVLRKARTERNLTLDMVSDELMIRRFYLEALENGNFNDLPERVYATGFVRNYATYLGLDSVATVEQFRRDAYGTRNAGYHVELSMPQPVIHSVVPGRAAIITACAVLALVIAGVIYAATRDRVDALPEIPAPPVIAETSSLSPASEMAQIPADPTIPPSAATIPDNAAPNAASSNATSPSATSFAAAPAAVSPTAPATATSAATQQAGNAPQAMRRGMAIEALQSSWVEIKNKSGAILFTNILKLGQVLPLPEEEVTLTTGNAGGLRLLVDGKPVRNLGQANEVQRNIVLDPASLRQP